MNNSYQFISGTGETAQGWEAIVPILRLDEPPQMKCIGTGFFVHTGGILATAAHVIADVIGEDGLPKAGLAIVQYIPPNSFALRPVVKVSRDLRHDVALACCQTIADPTTKLPLKNKVVVMTTAIPKIGDAAYSWAFPKSVSIISKSSGQISINPKIYEGRILQIHPNGRDKVILPGRCYETDLGIENGASGGPVFNEHGNVFAINSTGFDGTDTAFVSHVQSLGGLPIEKVITGDGVFHKSITLHSLIERGEVPIEFKTA